MKLGRFHFGYNAVEDKGRRQAPQTRIKSEEEILTAKKRKKLLATQQDQIRNQSLVAWMVRRHLDYVSSFHVSFRTDNTALDDLVNSIFRWHGAPRNFDYLGRYGRDEMFRLFELEKVGSGDAGLLKLNDLKLQAIESDLIAKGKAKEGGEKVPEGINDSGLVVDTQGRVLSYAICQRGTKGGTPIFDHLEPTANMIFDGYWSRFSSQYRGVSPLATAVNMVQDIGESFEWNLIKAKMHALFGVAFLRQSQDTGDFGGAGGATAETADASATATGTELDLNPRAVNVFDMEQGDDIKILESTTPSTEFVNGSYLFIQIVMLALDIPITAFDSRKSSFSARIADLNEYEVSAGYKRQKNRYVRKEYSDWLLQSIWDNPRSEWRLAQVAQRADMSLREVQEKVEWIPSGSPWLDKKKQIEGDILAIGSGLDNSIDAARRRGGNVFTNIDKESQVAKYAADKGVIITRGKTTDRTIGEVVREEIANARGEEQEQDNE